MKKGIVFFTVPNIRRCYETIVTPYENTGEDREKNLLIRLSETFQVCGLWSIIESFSHVTCKDFVGFHRGGKSGEMIEDDLVS